MDSELIARISPEHRRRLAWFEEHQGEVSAFPGPLAGGLLLVSKPKGIYKPGDLPYALSIRINLDSPYEDGVPVPTPGGGWLLSYHQENADPAARDTMFTNRGLMRCIADRVPVGVLRERAPAGRRSQYDVLGLAMPVRWSDGYFFFESLNPQAVPVIDPVSDVLEAMARAEVDQRRRPAAGAWMTITMPVFASTGRSLPAAGSPGSGPRCWRPTRDDAPSPAATRLRPWKLPTCARTADRNPTPSPTGCCCGPTSTPCSISASWPLTRQPGPSWSPSCSPERNTRRSPPASSLTR